MGNFRGSTLSTINYPLARIRLDPLYPPDPRSKNWLTTKYTKGTNEERE
ncbi:MAG: hypothetical protein QUS14_11315 [Pyrinomonadaceae bacterium]|nr:hypothetical protein [Pyrinomonadaceae bacterium]